MPHVRHKKRRGSADCAGTKKPLTGEKNMSEQKEKLLALMRRIAIPLFVGGLFGFLFAMFFEWGMMNILFNIPDAFYIITIVLFFVAFLLLGCSLYLLYSGHAFAGAFCLVAGFKLLNWILQWYLPYFFGGYWESLQWLFFDFGM